MPPKAANSSARGSGGGATSPSAKRSSSSPVPAASLPPQLSELPVSWEDPTLNRAIDPAVALPLEPYDESAALKAPSGEALHALLEEDEKASAAYTADLARMTSQLSKHTSDTTDMVRYLEAEIRRKDLMAKRMQRQMDDLRTTHAQDLQAMSQQFDQTCKFMEKLFLDKESQMLNLTQKLEGEIQGMEGLAAQRRQIAQELEETKLLIFKNERAHKLQLDELEKRFLAARDGLQQEAAARITHSRANYKLEVGRELESESAAVRAENARLKHTLKLHESTSDALQHAHQSLTARIYSLKQDLELRNQMNEEYRSKSQRQQKRIAAATQTTQEMEAQLLAEMKKAAEKKERRETNAQARAAPLHEAIAVAREEAAAADRANSSLRRAARRALRARQEVDAFFLSAIEETRASIARREAIQKKEKALLQAAKLRELTLPVSLRSKLPFIHSAQSGASEGIFTSSQSDSAAGSQSISDLTLSDRSKLLRLLYAKIAHIPSGLTMRMPEHSFSLAITGGEQQAAGAAATAAQPMLSLPATPALPAVVGRSESVGLPQLLPASSAASAANSSRAAAAAAPSSSFDASGPSYDNTFLTNARPEDDDDGEFSDEGDTNRVD